MMPDVDDLLVAVGIGCVAVGVWLLLGMAATLILVGVVSIAAGVWWAVKKNDRQLDRTANR